MKWVADIHVAGPIGSMGQRVFQPIVNQQVGNVLERARGPGRRGEGERVMRRLALVAVLALAVRRRCSPARRPPHGRGKCIPDKQAGVTIVNHTAVIVYCGHAKLTITSDGKTTPLRAAAPATRSPAA